MKLLGFSALVVLIQLLLEFPVSYHFMDHWLSGFTMPLIQKL